MAEISSGFDIIVKQERRLCKVLCCDDSYEYGYFHKWVEENGRILALIEMSKGFATSHPGYFEFCDEEHELLVDLNAVLRQRDKEYKEGNHG